MSSLDTTELSAQSLAAQGGPMEVGRFLRIAVAVAGVVADLHRRNILHCDLKPASIFVDAATLKVRIAESASARTLAAAGGPPAARRAGRIEGSFAYMAPEQTGRMNRAIDARSDLYSLGVTLYELLTGQLPFQARDTLELVHSHIARTPVPPTDVLPTVPQVVSNMVMKLLAKEADDRYQTADGLRLDLERCIESLNGTIEPFALGAGDISDRLEIPQKLYGRDDDLQALQRAFDGVVDTGEPELVLVSGYSGIGKSALVHEFHRHVARGHGRFAEGKFDQLKRDVPYATVTQALTEIVLEILAEPEAEVTRWGGRLRQAVGDNGQLLVDVVPPLELVIGKQQPVAPLAPAEAQNRIRRLFRECIGVFAEPEHPLVLFLDDLQWADSASIELVLDLVTHPGPRHLLLVGAYRDDEFNPSRPVAVMADALRRGGGRVSDVKLGPLAPEHLAAFVSDTLHQSVADTAALTELVREKTAGNPFFTIQFLKALHDDGLIELDRSRGVWVWDIERTRAKGFTDNVVDLMVGKLKRLPTATRAALKELACLGSSADVATLALVMGVSEAAVHRHLAEAVRAGFLFRLEEGGPRGSTYRFLHDRVQETAYSLVGTEERPAAHLRIGRALAARLAPADVEERVFDVVNQLNRGLPLITDAAEKEALCRLNLRAATRAKASAAFASANIYFSLGISLLEEDSWSSRSEITTALYLGKAECEFIAGDLAESERICGIAQARVNTTAARAKFYLLQITLAVTKGEFALALGRGVECLAALGLEFPAHPTAKDVAAEERRVWDTQPAVSGMG
jgi:predicted ATPase